MVTVILPSRLICTKEFYDKFLSKSTTYLDKCMRININSKQHKRDHIIISKKDFGLIISETPSLKDYPDVLMAALKRKSEPENIEAGEDPLLKTIEYAIYFSSKEPPFHSVILTTKEMVEKYTKNIHIVNMRNVEVKFDQDAMRLIDTFYSMCMDKDYY